MKKFSESIKRIKVALSYLEESASEFKNVQKNIKIIAKLERDLNICKTQSLENEDLVKKATNDIDKLLLNKSDS